MLQQLLDAREGAAVGALGHARLQREPLVDDQRLVLEGGMEMRQRALGEFGMGIDERGKRTEALGHVVSVLDALEGAARPDAVAAPGGVQAEHRQRQVGQGAPAGRHRVGRVGADDLVGFEGPGPVVVQLACELRQHEFAHAVDALRMDRVELLREQLFVGQFQHQGLERGVEVRLAQHAAHGVDEGGVEHRFAFAADRAQQARGGQALAGVPAVEGVAVVLQQHQQVGVGQGLDQDHRRREAAQQRGHRLGIDVDESEEVLGLVEHQHAFVLFHACGRRGLVLQLQRQRAAVVSDQAERERDDVRQALGLARRGRVVLLEAERVGARMSVVAPARGDAWRARL